MTRNASHMATACAILAFLGNAEIAVAQATGQDISPLELPNPDYEYDGLRMGGATVLAKVDVSAQYDSNVYAASQIAIDDYRFLIEPSIRIRRQTGTISATAEAFGVIRRHAEQTREDSEDYGASIEFRQAWNERQNFSLSGGYIHATESRADPETRLGPTDLPRQINALRAEVIYRQPIGRFGLQARSGIDVNNFLDPADDDRDVRTMRALLQLSYRTSPGFDVFVDGYVNRRDFRLAQDFGGVNRDTNTLGADIGIHKEIGQRLRGRIAIGFFRALPDSPSLEPYTELGGSAEVIWNPRTRTALSLRFTRGDQGTVRSGANGLTDTNVRIRIDQEIRHNLTASLTAIYNIRDYRGTEPRRLKTARANGEVEYRLGRHIALWAGIAYAKRDAEDIFDRFAQKTATAGLRWKI